MSAHSHVLFRFVRRASPLPPDERRQAIIAATRPLLISSGGQFTTKQVAEAAGIAEGTIFRVFATKQDLLAAVIEDALDPTALCRAIEALPAADSLTAHIAAILTEIRGELDATAAVMAALHAIPIADAGACTRPSIGHGTSVQLGHARMLRAAIEDALEPWAGDLRLTVEQAAALLHSIAFVTSHPFMAGPQDTDSQTLADVIVHGFAKDQEC